jgi:hypothetical protein
MFDISHTSPVQAVDHESESIYCCSSSGVISTSSHGEKTTKSHVQITQMTIASRAINATTFAIIFFCLFIFLL